MAVQSLNFIDDGIEDLSGDLRSPYRIAFDYQDTLGNYAEAYAAGYAVGHADGIVDGYADAYADGYAAGFADGLAMIPIPPAEPPPPQLVAVVHDDVPSIDPVALALDRLPQQYRGTDDVPTELLG